MKLSDKFFKNKAVYLVVFVAFLLLVTTKFTAWPEMVAWPYLALNGLLPYESIAVAHTPLLIYALAGFYGLFGVGVIQLKIFTWLLFATTLLLLFRIAKAFWDEKTAFVSVLLYSILYLLFDGNGLWFDHALAPIALVLYWNLRKKRYLLAGCIFALGVLTKQTFVYFLLPLVIEIVQSAKNKKQSVQKAFVGAIIVGGIALISLYITGILYGFYFWTVVFGIFYLPGASGQISLPSLKQLAYAILPLSISLLSVPLLPWVIAGSLGVYPRFELFHFQPALPFVALGGAVLFSSKRYLKITYLYLFVVALLFIRFLAGNITNEVRFYEPEVVEVANYVKSVSEPGDKIYVANYWDSVYAYTDTLPAAKPLVPFLSWYLEFPNIEQQLVKQLVSVRPAIVVQGKYKSGLSGYKPAMVVEFIMRNYEIAKEFENVEVLKIKLE